jgi:TonB family protein
MAVNDSPGRSNFGLLPEPEGRSAPFITSSVINLILLLSAIYIGMTAKHTIEQHFEVTELVAPTIPPEHVKPPEMPKLPPPPKPAELQMEAPKIAVPKQAPAPKPIEMQAKLALPVVKPARPSIILAPQPKAALTAAMPAQTSQVRPSTAPVHLGQTFGVTPNPNATRPATIAAIGNPYGGMQGPAVAPHGVVGSTGIGNGTRSGSNAGVVGRVASAGIPGASGSGTRPGSGTQNYGRVASAGIPAMTPVAAAPRTVSEQAPTSLQVLSKPSAQYTAEARQMHIQGDVVLRVTFLANGQIVVQSLVHGLGHGLDEEARREAERIRFRPATRNGRPVDLTTNIIITFQLA